MLQCPWYMMMIRGHWLLLLWAMVVLMLMVAEATMLVRLLLLVLLRMLLHLQRGVLRQRHVGRRQRLCPGGMQRLQRHADAAIAAAIAATALLCQRDESQSTEEGRLVQGAHQLWITQGPDVLENGSRQAAEAEEVHRCSARDEACR